MHDRGDDDISFERNAGCHSACMDCRLGAVTATNTAGDWHRVVCCSINTHAAAKERRWVCVGDGVREGGWGDQRRGGGTEEGVGGGGEESSLALRF